MNQMNRNNYRQQKSQSTCLLATGQRFESFSDLEKQLAIYQNKNFVQLYKRSSRTIQGCQKLQTNKKPYNPALKYAVLDYTCIHGGKKFRSVSKGARQNTRTLQIDCPMSIKIRATPDGQYLMITEMKEDHNHETSEELYYKLPRQRHMDKLARITAEAMLELKNTHSHIQLKATDEFIAEDSCTNVSSEYTMPSTKTLSHKLDTEADNSIGCPIKKPRKNEPNSLCYDPEEKKVIGPRQDRSPKSVKMVSLLSNSKCQAPRNDDIKTETHDVTSPVSDDPPNKDVAVLDSQSISSQQTTQKKLCIPSPLMCYPIILEPGQEIKTELLKFVQENHLKAAFVMSCVGSVVTAKLRMADSITIKSYSTPHEIVSLVGTLSDGGHLHISLSDVDGHVIGGHVVGDLIVHTTAEIMIGDCPSALFTRVFDNNTGYKELSITKR